MVTSKVFFLAFVLINASEVQAKKDRVNAYQQKLVAIFKGCIAIYSWLASIKE